MSNCKKYIANRFKSLRNALKTYPVIKDPEALHQFRVEFKKLKALYLLAKSCHPDIPTSKSFKKIRKFYKESGMVRDSDIIGQLLEKNKISLTCPEAATAEAKKLKSIDRLCRHIPAILHAVRNFEKQLIRNTSRLTADCIKKYLSEKEAAIQYKIEHPDTAAVLHDIRKEIKRLKYTADMEPGFIQKRKLSRYNTLQDRIGNWHDKLVLIEYLEAIQPGNRRPINKLLEESSRNADAIKNSLLTLV